MLHNGCSVQKGAWSEVEVAQGRQHENWISGERQWLLRALLSNCESLLLNGGFSWGSALQWRGRRNAKNNHGRSKPPTRHGILILFIKWRWAIYAHEIGRFLEKDLM